jgi:hypothetical protein
VNQKNFGNQHAIPSNVKAKEQIESYQQQIPASFLIRLGGFPERTPLNAQITGHLMRKSTVEQINNN